MAHAPAPRLVGRFPLLQRYRPHWCAPLQCGFCGAQITYGEVLMVEANGRLGNWHPQCFWALQAPAPA